MKVEILSPEKKIFEGEADGVLMPGTTGFFEVLNRHAPMIASLKAGKMRVRRGKEDFNFIITGGFMEMLNNHLSILVESAVKE
jgi:F-type H+-transporting ATPase subunit epsilon